MEVFIYSVCYDLLQKMISLELLIDLLILQWRLL
jgi:hypothetical protein